MPTIRLALTSLEDRLAPAVWGNPWPIPRGLTMSFAQDGTDVSSSPANPVPSRLYSQFADMGVAVWQQELLRAAQTWAAAANLSVGLVADDGKPFSVGGPVQGDPNRGDIRIGARPLPSAEVAVATPFDLSGKWSGEVVINTNYRFSKGGGNGTYDLYSVVVHEIGHALGMGPSTDPLSVMYETYSGVRVGLGASDVAGIRGIYGARAADRYDSGLIGNDTRLTATDLSFTSDADDIPASEAAGLPLVAAASLLLPLLDAPHVANGDLTTADDKDFYRFTVPLGTTDFMVHLRTTGVGIVRPKLTLTDALGNAVRTWAMTDVRDGEVVASFRGLPPGVYTVKVEAADPTRFAVGSYLLAVGKVGETAQALFPKAAPDFVNPDGGTDDSVKKARDAGTADLRGVGWGFTHAASIETAGDKDFYKFKTGRDGGALILTVWSAAAGKLDPVLRVYDSAGNRVAVQVLTNDADIFTIQVRNAKPNATYSVEVAATDPQGGHGTGSYFLAGDLRATPVEPTRVAAGTLTQSDPRDAYRMSLSRSQLMQLTLTADATPGVQTVVRLTIFDGQGKVVGSIVARAGETVSDSFLLGPGTYVIKVSAATQDGQPLPTVGYAVDVQGRNDPIMPEEANPYEGSGPPPTEGERQWQADSDTAWYDWCDPYGDPWYGV